MVIGDGKPAIANAESSVAITWDFIAKAIEVEMPPLPSSTPYFIYGNTNICRSCYLTTSCVTQSLNLGML